MRTLSAGLSGDAASGGLALLRRRGVSLLSSVAALWPMEEYNGMRQDVIGASHLTQQTSADPTLGAVASTAGLVGRAVILVAANGTRLIVTSNAALQMADTAFSIACIVRTTTVSGAAGVMGKWGLAGEREYLLYRNTNKFEFYVSNNGTAFTLVQSATIAINTTYRVAAYHDPNLDVIGISVNGAVPVTAAHSTGAFAGTSPFRTGASGEGVGFFDGWVDESIIWRGRVLDMAAITALNALWSAGQSLSISAFPFDGSVSAVSRAGMLYINNGIGFRDQGIASIDLSGTTYQALAWLNKDRIIQLSTRTLPSGAWSTYALPAAGQSQIELHNAANIGIDPNGYIHICYRENNAALLYRRSTNPISTFDGTWSSTRSMLGTNETSVSYPTFFNAPDGTLYFMFRNGQSGQGDLYFYTYNHGADTWAAAAGTSTAGLLISGTTSSPDESPYWDRSPHFDDDFGSGGFMHLSWCWRETGVSTTNHDIAYMRWDGTTFTRISGSAQTIPVTTANDDVVAAITQSEGLLNQNSIDSDSAGHPHIGYVKTVSSHAALFHLWHNGTTWVNTQITNGPTPPWDGSASLPSFARPLVIVDRDTDTVHILYRDDGDVPGLLVWSAVAPYTTWTQQRPYSRDLGFQEFAYDRQRWQQSAELHIPIWPYSSDLDDGVVAVLEWTP